MNNTGNKNTLYRVEQKYVISKEDAIKLESRISIALQKDMYSGDEGYKISSLYFDFYDNKCFFDTINGNPIRKKYRARVYDDRLTKVKMEVKGKVYNYSHKQSTVLSKNEWDTFINGGHILSLNDSVLAEFDLLLANSYIRPVVIVTYERKAYVYEPGSVRITFDYNVRCTNDCELFGVRDIIYDYPYHGYVIVEVKYNSFIPHYIAQLLENGNMMRVANSKYALCRALYIQ